MFLALEDSNGTPNSYRKGGLSSRDGLNSSIGGREVEYLHK